MTFEDVKRLRARAESDDTFSDTDQRVAIVRLLDELVLVTRELNAAKGGEAIPMRLTCPTCGELHVDEGAFATKLHHTHACQDCGQVWRPAVVNTVGVRFLPGFKSP